MHIATHSGTFHADDVLALATLYELGLVDSVTRTRDEAELAKADMRVDVGGAYDHATKNYDHHQPGGAGVRPNSIPYAAFGLIWRHYGPELCGSQVVADIIDRELVQSLDAEDCGLEGYRLIEPNLQPYSLGTAINRFNPQWDQESDDNLRDEQFAKAVAFARECLQREIVRAKAFAKGEAGVRAAIAAAADPRIVVLDKHYPWRYTVTIEAPQALYVVYMGEKTNDWRVQVVDKAVGSFEARKPLPAAWAGKRDAELASITGVAEARFCHSARFMAAANTKEAALTLARLAVEAKN
ncbi:MAG TPA: MYG1 family protein [Candidatus Acidoferrum sp.]|nr:MYG1 family protein [Candidatus Acidoferrum sp.]